MRRRRLFALLVVLAACGGRTGLFSFEALDNEPPEGGAVVMLDAGAVVDGALPAEDSSAPFDAALDVRDESTDARPDVHIPPGDVSCLAPPGLQPGSPWPIAQRCPARGGYTTAVGSTTVPTVAWQLTATGAWFNAPVIAADGTLYIHDTGRGIVALNPNGTVRWVTPVPNGTSSGASLAIATDGTLYAFNGTLMALRPDGSIVWTTYVTAYPQAYGTLTVGADGTVYVLDQMPFTSPEQEQKWYTSRLYALDPSGHLSWTKSLGADTYSSASPAIGASGAIYCVAQYNSIQPSALVAYTAEGELAWSASIPGASFFTYPVVGGDGTVYVPSYAGLQMFTADGQLLQRVGGTFEDGVVVLSPTDDTAFVLASSGFFAIRQGAVAWSSPHTLYDGPGVVDGRGVLYATCPTCNQASGPLVAVNPADGSFAWSRAAAKPLAIGGDGTLYTCGQDDAVSGAGCSELIAFSP